MAVETATVSTEERGSGVRLNFILREGGNTFSGMVVTQVKFLGSYEIPKIDVLISGALQSVAGPQVIGNFVATSLQIDF